MSIPEIKSRLPIATVLAHYGLHPNHNGMLCCPFHEDQKASMKVYYATNTAYCFSGSCKVGHVDVIDFILHKEQLSKHASILKAKSLIPDCSPQAKSSMKKEPIHTPDVELLTKLFYHFEKGIKHPQAKRARAYKAQRGLNGALGIGYNSGRFHEKKPAELLARLKQSGLIRRSEGGYKAWGHSCLIFPLKDASDQIVSLYGRSVLDEGHYYLKHRRGLYPGYPGRAIKRLVLTESVIDAASLLQVTLPLEDYAVLALYGSNGLGKSHREALVGCIHLEEIIFALDGDPAGIQATRTYTRQLGVLYPHLRFTTLDLPVGEDINSLYVSHDDQQGLFSQLFSQRRAVSDTAPLPTPVVSPKPNTPTTVIGKLTTDNEELLQYRASEVLTIWIMGGIKLEGLDRLRVSLKCCHELAHGAKTYRDHVDLYSAAQVEKLLKRLCSRLELSSKYMQGVLEQLTDALERYRLGRLESGKEKQARQKMMSEWERQEALGYLKAGELLKRTGEDIGKSGVIGEENNRLVLFLIYLSRKMGRPLHALIFGKSGSGKTHLQSGVSALVPEEDKLETTTLSDNAVYYFGENEISHFLILIEDMDGAEGVLLALRELQSKQEVRKTVTIKDDKGRMKTITLVVRGPISLSGCTTKERVYEDNANRSFLLYVDGTSQQDERIMDYQRKDSAGKINRKEQELIKTRFKNMQRLLKPIRIVNPYAEYIRLPKEVFKPRRSNAHVLQFIEAVSFYHQYQRPLKLDEQTGERYIETTVEDIEASFAMLEPVLLHKSDELGSGCRSFYEQVKKWLREKGSTSFYKRELRCELRINPNTLKYYINELLRYGYIQMVGGHRYRGGYEYEALKVEEYEELQSSIHGSLGVVLEKIRGHSG